MIGLAPTSVQNGGSARVYEVLCGARHERDLKSSPCRHAGAMVRRYLPPKARPMIAITGPARSAAARPARRCWRRPAARPRAHTGDMRRIIGTILGAILAISLAVTAVGRIVASLK